ncbi:MAG: cobaltochelatase subunit CobN, partial [Streptosporangiaceae bacterium]|nr:cobaltochelatase subunit CobN [Streptosporangiaceae bacterium]
LIHTLIAAGGHDTEWLTEEQLRTAQARVPLATYRSWFSGIPNEMRRRVAAHWGEPPGSLYVDGSDIVLAALRFGNVVLMIQPPRGFGENPVAIYHDPGLPPSHHYLAAYRWLEEEFGADAIVHLGKHGTLEWLPGKGLGLSASCAPDLVLRDLPLVYPFIVNDPGEGTQAKRRGHATIVDHLVPPMARADSYGDLAKLEQLLDEYATVAALDPDKLPAIRARIWALIRAASLHHDLGVAAEPGAAEFDDFVLHVDGYLCEVKDAAIRDGLHVLGQAPAGEALVNLVLVILRSPQLWSARWGALPGLRSALGHAEGGASPAAFPSPATPPSPPPASLPAVTPARADASPPLASASLTAVTPAQADASPPPASASPPPASAPPPPASASPAAVTPARADASPPTASIASLLVTPASEDASPPPASARAETDAYEGAARALVQAMADADWDRTRAAEVAARVLAASHTPPLPGTPVPPSVAPRGTPSPPPGAAAPPPGAASPPAPPPDAASPPAPPSGAAAPPPGAASPPAPPSVSDLSAVSVAITTQTADKSGAAPPTGESGAAAPGDEHVALVARVLEFACAEVVPRLRATGGEISAVLHALDGGYVPAGPSGSPTRGLVNVLPTGRNFYSVDPKAIPSLTSWETGQALAASLVARHLRDEGAYPRCVGLTVWGTSAMRTQGDDIAEVLALIGCRPEWDESSRRVTGFAVTPLAELGRPRIDVTLRISGFFRDAFPHVIALLDDAIGTVAGLDEPPESNYVRAHALADAGRHGDWRRATTRIFGSKPGAYGAGLLPLIDARNWRDDADLAEVYAVWGGYAYGRALDGAPARRDMESAFRRIAVAAKNTDTREHDIADSDDYFQYHGGMVAMVRALTGRNPAAYIGDSAVPDAVRTRTLAEETRRVFRSRVVNPRWIAAMRRHGYKGAFELAATVDYLFGYDATAGVVADWMYEQLAAAYVFDAETRSFMERSNPWALRGMAERLLEAAQRGMWAEPDPKTLDQLRQAFLDTEGDLEGGAQA